jgi:hypothetical protein
MRLSNFTKLSKLEELSVIEISGKWMSIRLLSWSQVQSKTAQSVSNLSEFLLIELNNPVNFALYIWIYDTHQTKLGNKPPPFQYRYWNRTYRCISLFPRKSSCQKGKPSKSSKNVITIEPLVSRYFPLFTPALTEYDESSTRTGNKSKGLQQILECSHIHGKSFLQKLSITVTTKIARKSFIWWKFERGSTNIL